MLTCPSSCCCCCRCRALDLGCAVGRSSFEMARMFQQVVGIDLSQTFIDMANQMKTDGSVGYRLKVEGDIATEVVAKIDPAIDASRCTFLQVNGRYCYGFLCVF